VATGDAAALRIRDSDRSLHVPAMATIGTSDGMRVSGGRCLLAYDYDRRVFDFGTAQLSAPLRGTSDMNRAGELRCLIEAESQVVKITRTAEGGTREQFSVRLENPGGYRSLGWTNDGLLLWAVSDDWNSIRFWSAADGKVTRTIDLSRSDLKSAEVTSAFSPDGGCLVVIRREKQPLVRIWSRDLTEPTHEFRVPYNNFVRLLAVSPDGQRFATERDGSADFIQIWDARTAKVLASIRTDTNGSLHPLRFELSPSGRYLLTPRRV